MKLLLSLLLCLPSFAAVAKVQTAGATSGTDTLTFTVSTTTVGNVLVACTTVTTFGEDRTVTPPDGSWTQIDVAAQASALRTYVWTKTVTAGATSYAFTATGSWDSQSGVIYELSGASPTPNQHQISTVASSTNPVTTDSVTPSVLNTLAISCLGMNEGSGDARTMSSVSSGWTLDQSAIPNTRATYGASKDALTSDTTTAISNTFTLSGNTNVGIKWIGLFAPPATTRHRKAIVL